MKFHLNFEKIKQQPFLMKLKRSWFIGLLLVAVKENWNRVIDKFQRALANESAIIHQYLFLL